MQSKRIALTSSLVLFGFGLVPAASALELRPLQAGTFVLGQHIASIYYTESDGAFEVVTTIAPTLDPDGAPIRFTGSLAEGQSQMISVGAFGPDSPEPIAIELAREGDRVRVQPASH